MLFITAINICQSRNETSEFNLLWLISDLTSLLNANPSKQTDVSFTFENLDLLAYREYLMQEKICENFASNKELSSLNPSPSMLDVSYWDRAKSIPELVLSKTGQYKFHQQHTEATAADSGKGYSNPKNIKALCIQGKQFSIGNLVGRPAVDFVYWCGHHRYLKSFMKADGFVPTRLFLHLSGSRD